MYVNCLLFTLLISWKPTLLCSEHILYFNYVANRLTFVFHLAAIIACLAVLFVIKFLLLFKVYSPPRFGSAVK